MNYTVFEQMTLSEANEFLETFLAMGMEKFAKIRKELSTKDANFNFEITSISQVFEANLKNLKRGEAPDYPKTEQFLPSITEFDQKSSASIFACAFFLGESFNRLFESVSWKIGNGDTAFRNMPVIRGFTFEHELAPLVVAENIAFAVMRNETTSRIDEIVDYWISVV